MQSKKNVLYFINSIQMHPQYITLFSSVTIFLLINPFEYKINIYRLIPQILSITY